MKLIRHSAPSRFVLAGLILMISLFLSVGAKNNARVTLTRNPTYLDTASIMAK